MSADALPIKESELQARCAGIELLALDIDGVLTDGRLYYGAEGESVKVFHVHDGYGLRRVIETGVRVAVISGRRSRAAERRMQELGIDTVILGCEDKRSALARLTREAGLDTAQVAAVGDDLPDRPMFEAAGLCFAVADAHPDLVASADWVTRARGGRGAVREICDLLIAARSQHR